MSAATRICRADARQGIHLRPPRPQAGGVNPPALTISIPPNRELPIFTPTRGTLLIADNAVSHAHHTTRCMYTCHAKIAPATSKGRRGNFSKTL